MTCLLPALNLSHAQVLWCEVRERKLQGQGLPICAQRHGGDVSSTHLQDEAVPKLHQARRLPEEELLLVRARSARAASAEVWRSRAEWTAADGHTGAVRWQRS